MTSTCAAVAKRHLSSVRIPNTVVKYANLLYMFDTHLTSLFGFSILTKFMLLISNASVDQDNERQLLDHFYCTITGRYFNYVS